MSTSIAPVRSAPLPPRPAPKPGHVKVVRALYPYTAQQPDELSFEEGDLLYITDMVSSPDWWKARCGSSAGLIPSNYVEESTEEIITPLHDAAKRGNLEFLKECLFNKVSVNRLDKAGCTALHWAAHGGHRQCVEDLLAVHGIDINVQNKLGDTPLHNAAWKGHSEIVKLLINTGADAFILNKENKSPFDLANDPETASELKILQRTNIQSASSNPEDYGSSDESD